MKSRKVLILAIIFALLTSIFAMSDDGRNEPQVEKKEVKQGITKANQSETQAKETKSNETVKDRLGFDTGMTKEEIIEFETNYYNRCKELGIQKDHFVAPGSYFKYKINLNAIDKMKNLGLFLKKDPNNLEEDFAFFVTHSDLIVIGTIEDIEYFFKTEEEESNAKGARSVYTVKVENILKGENLFEVIPNQIKYYNSTGKFIITSNDRRQNLNGKYIFFFQLYDGKIENLFRIRNSSLIIKDEEAFSVFSKNKPLRSVNEIVSIVEKYNEISNPIDFYKRKYVNEEVDDDK
ncbi:MAG: hypothetical protein PF638_05260 [Candidatus Delongbacteria bacterium]|jgi:hypothetical protein|nr:hypothetical protein [Candidatus Delongbacteria bacterium]